MTTARIKYRDYIPWGWIAIEFCEVEFIGDDAKRFKEEWHNIEYARYDENQPKIDELKLKLEPLKERASKLNDHLYKNRPKWKFWYTKEEKEIKACLAEIESQMMKIQSSIKAIENTNFLSSRELRSRAENYLSKNGFSLKSSNGAGSECITYTDIWEKQ